MFRTTHFTSAILFAFVLCLTLGRSTGIAKDPPASAPATQMSIDLGHGVSMQLTLIPAGKFTMGSPKGEYARDADEEPFEVTLGRPFYMGVYEVTQEQYEAVMGGNPSKFKGAKNPVDSVSWADAIAFCRKLSEKTGKACRLPTEAEWEYACRAGTKTAFHTGETIDAGQANYDGNYVYGDGRKGEYRKQTIAVGQFRPNAFGLFDMHGNVCEWCHDWFQPYPTKPAVDPKPDSEPNFTRVLRGGSWMTSPAPCRSANRIPSKPEAVRSDNGFRVCIDAP
jgi:formylglycine-generating enzyme required for sulfatase activity